MSNSISAANIQLLGQLSSDIVLPAGDTWDVLFLTVPLPVATTGATATAAIVPALPVRYSLLALYVSCVSLQSNANLFVDLVLGGGTLSGAGAAAADMTAQQGMNATALDIIGGTVGAALIRKMTAVIPGCIIPDNADTRIPAGKSLAIQVLDDATHHMAAGTVSFTVVAAIRA